MGAVDGAVGEDAFGAEVGADLVFELRVGVHEEFCLVVGVVDGDVVGV